MNEFRIESEFKYSAYSFKLYIESPSNPYKTYFSAVIIAQNTNANITP